MVGTRRQGEVINSMGNEESKELIYPYDPWTRTKGGNVGGQGMQGRGAQRGDKIQDNRNP